MNKPFEPERHVREECGVFGIYQNKVSDVASLVYYGLYALQHRGQESAGIVVNKEGRFAFYRDIGLVSEVFTKERLRSLGQGSIAVGHVRYATTGADNARNIQPLLLSNRSCSIALAHNGNLSNSAELRTALEESGSIFHTSTDSEVIAYTIVREHLRCLDIETAVSVAMNKLEGAYSLVISSPDKLIAVRDRHGFRPLCIGMRNDGSWVFASETCALDAVGAKFVRDVEPGEIVSADANGLHSDRRHCNTAEKRMCVFEFIYFARPDSVIDGKSVTLARQQAGVFLAEEHPVEADAVIGVPDSGLDAAIGYSQASGIPYTIGLTKNKYIGRTFIAPTQSEREAGVNLKLNAVRSAIEGKRIVLIDDSIVRGTTSRRIVDLLRSVGAKEIHMRISAPPFIAPCFYGTDIDSADALIANHHTVDEIAKIIGVDSLGYLSLEHARLLTGEDTGFCTACFGGGYPTKIPQQFKKTSFEHVCPSKQ